MFPNYRDVNVINLAINNLKNCRNVPFIAEEVTVFVRNYERRITENEAFDNFLRHTTNGGQNRRHWEGIGIDENELERSGFFLRTCYIPFIAVVLIFAIVAIFLYFLDNVNTKLDAVTQERDYVDIDQNNYTNTVSDSSHCRRMHK